MIVMTYSLPLEMLYKWERNYPHKIFLNQPINGVWETWTWEEAGDEIRRMAAALKQMPVPARSNIALLSKNCAHWIMCDLAIMMAGHVSVPLYPNLSADSIRLT
jgi:long-chain acyl-CoA synthetase